MAEQKNRDVTVPMGMYLYIGDGTSGKMKVHVGPTVVNLTGTDNPVVYMKDEVGPGKFVVSESLEGALCHSHVVPEGFYAVLMNPTRDPKAPNDGHPPEGCASNISPELNIGHKVVIQGPKMFALWPGQHAKVVRGHSLRSNQWLLARIYNEEEARTNWTKATITTVGEGEGKGEKGAAIPKKGLVMPTDMTVGTLFVIRGTDVSFYVPPTGISVLPGNEGYTREAVSLEQLEYCILVDEDGTKRIPRGPAVIFPEPTETFVCGPQGEIKYRAMELNDIQGLHIKVTRPYRDALMDQDFKEGDEFFLTGRECPIYFPREEHALVRYDGNTKHFGVAIPAGEGRYVMTRNTGAIRTVLGPAMLLPNPVNEVIVRRVLSLRECELWYPGNQDALAYNLALSELAKKAPTTRAGVVSEGEATRASARGTRGTQGSSGSVGVMGLTGTSNALYSSAKSMQSLVSSDSVSAAGEELTRTSSYTAPRTLTLNTKFEGVPRVNIWTGYAVMVVNSKGERRVEIGPKTLLLDYDETLEPMSLSTGKPKTTDKLLVTPYLRVLNNKVADIVEVETADHVVVQLKVSYHINFTGEQTKWWDVQNYVKHGCDHMRSALKGTVRAMPIEEFYTNPLKVLKTVVLGEGGEGYLFAQNGMKFTDVELMLVQIPDQGIREMLGKVQREAVQRNIGLNDARLRLVATQELEALHLKEEGIKTTTEVATRDLAILRMAAKLKADLEDIGSGLQLAKQGLELRKAKEADTDLVFEAQAARRRKEAGDALQLAESQQALVLERLQAEAEAIAKKFSCIKDGMSEALLALSSNESLVKIAEATSVQRLVGGADVVEVLQKVFEGTGLVGALKLLASRAGGPEKSNGKPEQPTV